MNLDDSSNTEGLHDRQEVSQGFRQTDPEFILVPVPTGFLRNYYFRKQEDCMGIWLKLRMYCIRKGIADGKINLDGMEGNQFFRETKVYREHLYDLNAFWSFYPQFNVLKVRMNCAEKIHQNPFDM